MVDEAIRQMYESNIEPEIQALYGGLRKKPTLVERPDSIKAEVLAKPGPVPHWYEKTLSFGPEIDTVWNEFADDIEGEVERGIEALTDPSILAAPAEFAWHAATMLSQGTAAGLAYLAGSIGVGEPAYNYADKLLDSIYQPRTKGGKWAKDVMFSIPALLSRFGEIRNEQNLRKWAESGDGPDNTKWIVGTTLSQTLYDVLGILAFTRMMSGRTTAEEYKALTGKKPKPGVIPDAMLKEIAELDRGINRMSRVEQIEAMADVPRMAMDEAARAYRDVTTAEGIASGKLPTVEEIIETPIELRRGYVKEHQGPGEGQMHIGSGKPIEAPQPTVIDASKGKNIQDTIMDRTTEFLGGRVDRPKAPGEFGEKLKEYRTPHYEQRQFGGEGAPKLKEASDVIAEPPTKGTISSGTVISVPRVNQAESVSLTLHELITNQQKLSEGPAGTNLAGPDPWRSRFGEKMKAAEAKVTPPEVPGVVEGTLIEGEFGEKLAGERTPQPEGPIVTYKTRAPKGKQPIDPLESFTPKERANIVRMKDILDTFVEASHIAELPQVTKMSDLNLRTWSEIFGDLIGDESGAFMVEGWSPKQRIAVEALMAQMKTLKKQAYKKGYSVQEHLVETMGIPADIAREFMAVANSIHGPSDKTFLEKIKSGELVDQMYTAARTEYAAMKKLTPKQLWQGARRSVWDRSGNVTSEILKEGGPEGFRVMQMKDLAAGATSRAGMMLEEYNGKVYKGLGSSMKKNLDELITSRRIVEIDSYRPDVKHPKGLTGQAHQEALETFGPRKGLADAQMRDLHSRADIYFDVMREQLTNLRDDGILPETEYLRLRQFDYQPRKFLDFIDPEIPALSTNRISVRESGIHKLKGGSEGYLDIDSKSLLAQTVARTQSRIANNRANKALLQFIDEHPLNEVGIQRAPVKFRKKPKAGEPRGPLKEPTKTPPGFARLNVMIDGEPVAINMPNNLAAEWVHALPAVSHKMATGLRRFSGSFILKPMATGINVGFALTNFARDTAHIYFSAMQRGPDGKWHGTYSPFLPAGAGQMAHDLMTVGPDAWLRKGRFKEYIEDGGGMEFMTHQGRIISPLAQGKVIDGLKVAEKALAYAGETSEVWTRLAVRERAIRNARNRGLGPKDARLEGSWTARNYLDFAQGGWAAKAVDNAVPYLNASIQGSRGLVRAAWRNPKEFAAKAVQVGGLAHGLYMANTHINPEAWGQIRTEDKSRNWCVTTPFYFTDDLGDKRHMYIRIPKDQGQRILATAFELATAKFMGDEVETKQLWMGARDFLPVHFDDLLPPSLDAYLGYVHNWDFWRGKHIFQGAGGDTLSPTSREVTRDTPPAFADIGKKIGASPERLKYALSQFFTSGNIYTDAVGYGYNQMFRDLPKRERDRSMIEILKGMPIVRRFVGITSPYTPYHDTIQEARKEQKTEEWTQNLGVDIIAEDFIEGRATMEDVTTLIKREPHYSHERLEKRFEQAVEMSKSGITNRVFWNQVRSLSPERAAYIFHRRYSEASPGEQRMLLRDGDAIGGIFTDRFYDEFDKLMSAKKNPVAEKITAAVGR